MQMKLSGDIDAQQGFTLEHGGYSKSQQEGNMKAKRYYIPPCTIRLDHSAMHATHHLKARSALGISMLSACSLRAVCRYGMP